MHDLDHIKQGVSPIAEYTIRFRRIARLVPDLSERMQVYKFLNGLHHKIRLEVKLRQPENMTQAIHQATVIWGVVSQDEPPLLLKNLLWTLTPSPQTSTTSTMAPTRSAQDLGNSNLMCTPPWLREQNDLT